MKKIISLVLVAMMLFAVVACGNNGDVTTTTGATTAGTTAGNTTSGTTATTQGTTTTTTVVNPGFDENEIVLTFGAISDIHLEKNKSYDTENKFAAALNTLAQFADERSGMLDALVIVGDIGETKAHIQTFKDIYESVNLPGELLFTLGNHDQEAKYSNEALTLKDYKDVLGDKYFANEYNDLATGNRHMIVNGQHFIVVQPKCYINANGEDEVSFSNETVQWLDAKLNEITTADPNAYVFVFVHAMIKDTCYGSNLEYDVAGGDDGSYWYTSDLTSTLEKYNQVITFSGHLHFPVNDERSIMQNKFTSIGTGSVAYLAIENGYVNTASATVPQNAGNVSVGHLVEVDKYGNVRVTRIDFMAGTEMADAWLLDAPTADGAHLAKYSKNRAESNKAPSMTGVTPEVAVSTIGGNRIGALTFTVGTDDNFIHHYNIKVTNTTDGAVLKEVKYLTDFYLCNDFNNMAKTISYGLGAVVGGKAYKVEVTAVDSWGATSDTAVVTFTVPEGFDGTLPEALVDIDFNADGTATDKKGTATVELVGGATVSAQEFTHTGINKTLLGLHTKAAGDSATVTLKNFDVAAMSGLYNGASGFTIEAFYVNRAPSAINGTKTTQGVFCATEYGGLGLATTGGTGTPGLCLYTKTNVYKYTYSSVTPNTTDLVHVVATAILYDGNFYTSIYVNGELCGSATEASTGLWMTDSRYAAFANQLSLGNDVGPSGFPTSNMSIVDAKIYDTALNPAQVKTAYDAAAALFN